MAGTVTGQVVSRRTPSATSLITIDGDTTQSLTLVAAVAANTVDVWRIVLSSAGTTVVSIKSGTTLLMEFALVAGIPVVVDAIGDLGMPGGHLSMPLASTADGAALNITWSTSVALSGSIYATQRLTASP